MDPILSTDSISMSFGGIAALSDVTTGVYPGEVVGLIGPNGAGKTTLFNVMSGFVIPTDGRIDVEGEDVTGWNSHALARRKRLIRSWQDLRLFEEMTVLENVFVYAYGMAKRSRAKQGLLRLASGKVRTSIGCARDALEDVGLRHVEGELVHHLTYAQKKLVALARVVAASPRIALFDELNAGVDWTTRDEVIGPSIRRLAQRGTGVVIIEHSVNVISELCSRVIFLDRGSVRREGSPQEIMDDIELHRLYFGTKKDGQDAAS